MGLLRVRSGEYRTGDGQFELYEAFDGWRITTVNADAGSGLVSPDVLHVAFRSLREAQWTLQAHLTAATGDRDLAPVMKVSAGRYRLTAAPDWEIRRAGSVWLVMQPWSIAGPAEAGRAATLRQARQLATTYLPQS